VRVRKSEQAQEAQATEQVEAPANFEARMQQVAEDAQRQAQSEGFATPHAARAAQAASAFATGTAARHGVSGHILDMFRDANSARYAFMLREILDRPVSMRRRR
jgi:hypothetical protein